VHICCTSVFHSVTNIGLYGLSANSTGDKLPGLSGDCLWIKPDRLKGKHRSSEAFYFTWRTAKTAENYKQCIKKRINIQLKGTSNVIFIQNFAIFNKLRLM
jgi:hypothetical protein